MPLSMSSWAENNVGSRPYAFLSVFFETFNQHLTLKKNQIWSTLIMTYIFGVGWSFIWVLFQEGK